MKKVFLILIILLTVSYKGYAQFDAQFTQYDALMGYYNPGAAGSSKLLRLNAAVKMQWLGIKNAPTSILINGDMPLKFFGRTHGVGLTLFSEGLGLFDNITLGVQYAYQLKLFNGLLSIGVQPGFFNQSFDGTKVKLPDTLDSSDSGSGSGSGRSDDEAIPSSAVQSMSFDLNAGIYYNSPTIYGGISAMHLIEPTLKLVENYGTFVPRSYYLTLGYNIIFKESLFVLQPSAFLKTTFQFTVLDVQLKLIYNKMFWGGLNWRMNESVSLLGGVKLGKIKAGYAYDLPTSMLLKGSSGSHELFVSYELDLSLSKGNKNKYKSVRIL